MKEAKSEKEFDSLHGTCPYRKYPCIKDECTHFRRYHYKYECLKFKEETDTADCNAGNRIELWSEYKIIHFPPKPTSWTEWLLTIAIIICGILAIYWMATHPYLH